MDVKYMLAAAAGAALVVAASPPASAMVPMDRTAPPGADAGGTAGGRAMGAGAGVGAAPTPGSASASVSAAGAASPSGARAGSAGGELTARAAQPPRASDDALARIIDRPHTVAELEAGAIALPTAPIKPGQRNSSVPILRGDVTVQTGIHVLYRWNREFALGAGALFAPSPSSDEEYGGLGGIPRSHARSYLFLGGEGRYIPFHYKFFEAWAGLSLGGIVVADRFTTNAGDDVPALLGSRQVTVRTEGFAFGVQGGASYYLSESWIAGANLRAYRWILPETPRCSSIGDCATLTGTVEAFELGLTIGYRIPL
jgi:hypothetical protein